MCEGEFYPKSDDTYGFTKDSFIFSFKDENKIDDYILSQVKNEARATANMRAFGPSFGNKNVIDVIEVIE